MYRDLYTNIYRSVIYNGQKVEITKISIMVEWIYSHNGIIYNSKNEHLTAIHINVHKSWRYDTEQAIN